jgi:DNA-binding NtrC family response regulator
MDPRLQAKLLRAIQEHEIDRLGGNRPIKVDIRVIATSNRNLEAEVRRGRFREDLYFRLNVVHLDLPPLRARTLDIEVLARHFAQKYAELNGVPNRRLTAAALAALKRQPWRGNVRELENVMHRAVLLAHGEEIGPESILLSGGATPLGGESDTEGAQSITADAGGLVGRTVAEVERDLILSTLDRCLGNRTHAANILGISIRTLRNKLKQYSSDGVAIPMPREASRAAT